MHTLVIGTVLMASTALAGADVTIGGAGTQPGEPGCRRSPIAAAEWKSGHLKIVRDFDGDGIADRLEATEEHGTEYGGIVAIGPNPALSWLLDPSHGLQWHDGALPRGANYAIYTKGTWLVYLGINQSRGADADLGHAPEELASDGSHVLLGTAHGVILTDRARSRYAWIYITRVSSRKLRFPSIRAARLAGDTAIIDTIDGSVKVSLTTGVFRRL